MVAVQSDASRDMRGSTRSFVVVLWLEPSEKDRSGWRGHARSVQTDRQTYFSDLLRLQEFLKEETGQEFPRHIRTE